MTKINPKTQALTAEPQNVSALTAREVPTYLQTYQDDKSNELLKQYITPPRLKMVQPTSQAPFNDLFKQGDLILLPVMQKIAEHTREEKQAAFTMTPVMFFPEWCCWNPISTKGTLKGVRSRSFDRQSPEAIKARNPALRKSEICPEVPTDRGGKANYLRYLEHLNYLFIIHGNEEYADMAIAITFASGEHRAGTNFNALITQRRAPLWSMNFQAVIRRRTNDQGFWYGVDFENPDPSICAAWIDPGAAPRFEALHKRLREQYEEQLIQVDYEDNEAENASTVNGSATPM